MECQRNDMDFPDDSNNFNRSNVDTTEKLLISKQKLTLKDISLKFTEIFTNCFDFHEETLFSFISNGTLNGRKIHLSTQNELNRCNVVETVESFSSI